MTDKHEPETQENDKLTFSSLEVLRNALLTVTNLFDGGVNVPFVKGAAGIVIQLIDAAKVGLCPKFNLDYAQLLIAISGQPR